MRSQIHLTLACLIAVFATYARPAFGQWTGLVFETVTDQTGVELVYPGEETTGGDDGEDYGGGGIAVADFDGDDDLDMVVAGGMGYPVVLLRNDGNWQFTPLSEAVGLKDYGWEKGITSADYDNDGDPDLFVAVAAGGQRLLANNGDGIFTNVTSAAGLSAVGDARVGVWTDFDRDGHLDLYVARYGSIPEGATNSLYRNLGDGTFEEVTEEAQIAHWPPNAIGPGTQGNTWMSMAFDYNNDGFADIYDGNDWGYKHYNYGHKMWESLFGALPFSLATPEGGTDILCNCMGPTIGDINGDGWFDIYFANTHHGNLLLYNHCGTFADAGGRKGLQVGILSWSSQFADFDLDADLDLYVTTWHSGRNKMFFQEDGHWNDVSNLTASSGKYWENTTSATGDFDNDGDLDLVLLNVDSPMVFLRNEGPTGYPLRIRLVGTLSNRDAIGATVRLHLRGKRQFATRMSPNAFLSSSDPFITFGLGKHAKAEAISVHWPSGSVETFEGPFIGGSTVELIESETPPEEANTSWIVEFCGDGVDNDCNGEIDEGFEDLGQPCTVGLGDCERPGFQRCNIDQTTLLCDASPGDPREERCDGRDNDCDGIIDEDSFDGAPCTLGIGACTFGGTLHCLGQEGLFCDAVPLPPGPAELCNNGIDDDCDGDVDEPDQLPGTPCIVGDAPCDGHGVWSCAENGDWECTDTTFPHAEEELCGNGIDDDCDGEIDETNLPLGESCPVLDGECDQPGTRICGEDGATICAPPAACTDLDENDDPGNRDGCLMGHNPAPSPPLLFLFTLVLALSYLRRRRPGLEA